MELVVATTTSIQSDTGMKSLITCLAPYFNSSSSSSSHDCRFGLKVNKQLYILNYTQMYKTDLQQKVIKEIHKWFSISVCHGEVFRHVAKIFYQDFMNRSRTGRRMRQKRHLPQVNIRKGAKFTTFTDQKFFIKEYSCKIKNTKSLKVLYQ